MVIKVLLQEGSGACELVLLVLDPSESLPFYKKRLFSEAFERRKEIAVHGSGRARYEAAVLLGNDLAGQKDGHRHDAHALEILLHGRHVEPLCQLIQIGLVTFQGADQQEVADGRSPNAGVWEHFREGPDDHVQHLFRGFVNLNPLRHQPSRF